MKFDEVVIFWSKAKADSLDIDRLDFVFLYIFLCIIIWYNIFEACHLHNNRNLHYWLEIKRKVSK